MSETVDYEELEWVIQRRAADRLADEVAVLVMRGDLDARSAAGDRLLDYRNPPRSPRSDRLLELEYALAASQAETLALRQRVEASANGMDTLQQRIAELEGVLKFAGDILEESDDASYVGGDVVQERALACGLLRTETRTEPCESEGCACSEFGFPITCYRYTELGLACIRAAYQPIRQESVAQADSLAALGRMLKEGE